VGLLVVVELEEVSNFLYKLLTFINCIMKKILIIIILLLSFSFVVFADYSFPQPNGYVNDYAGVISSSGSTYINSVIKHTEQNTSAEIALVTLSSINDSGLDTKTYAVQLFQEWGIGKKGKDDGVLVLLVMDQRRIEIEVGYGLEGILPDGKVGNIIRANTPYLKEGNYSIGLEKIIKEISDEVLKDQSNKNDKSSFNIHSSGSDVFVGLAVFFISLVLLGVFIFKTYQSVTQKKCPKCGTKMNYKIERDFIVYTCPKCKYKEKKKRCHPLILAGAPGYGSGGGSSGGGFGGGSSGGGGAGGSF